MSSMWLVLIPAEFSAVGHIVLDLTSLAYQPKSRERSAYLKRERHVTFDLSEQESAYPAKVGDVKAPNKVARQLKFQPVQLQFWPLTGPCEKN